MVARMFPLVRSMIRTFNGEPTVPSRHETAISVPGPRSMPVGSQSPSGYTLNPFPGAGSGNPAFIVLWLVKLEFPVATKEAGMTSTSPSGFAVVPSLFTRKLFVPES